MSKRKQLDDEPTHITNQLEHSLAARGKIKTACHMDVCVRCRDEFTNFMFLEKAQAAAGEGDSDNWRLFPADFRDKNSATSMHHEQVGWGHRQCMQTQRVGPASEHIRDDAAAAAGQTLLQLKHCSTLAGLALQYACFMPYSSTAAGVLLTYKPTDSCPVG